MNKDMQPKVSPKAQGKCITVKSCKQKEKAKKKKHDTSVR